MTSSMKVGSSLHSRNFSALSEDRQQTAVRSAAQMVLAGVQHDLASRGWTGAPSGRARCWCAGIWRFTVSEKMSRARRSAGGARGSSARACGRRRSRTTSPFLGERRPNGIAVAHRIHELVGDVDAVVEVQGLAVEVARGFADFQELLDLRVVDVEIDRRRAAAQRALADRQGQRVHHADEGDDAGGLAVLPLTFSPIERTPPQ